jgi:hypothetical protein
MLTSSSSHPKLLTNPSNYLNMRDAIRLNDHFRIRNGSPGCSTSTTENNKRNSSTLESKRSFEEEMEEKGIISEIKDLNRFKYVLVTRSSPMEDVE